MIEYIICNYCVAWEKTCGKHDSGDDLGDEENSTANISSGRDSINGSDKKWVSTKIV